jgi:phage baseplate assembly protein W
MLGMDRNTGAPLDGTAHLAQSIGDILTTPLGSRVMRRDYGSMLFDLIDQPLNPATRLLIFASTAIALRQWEPRIRLRRVGLHTASAEGRAVITIDADRIDVPAPNSRVTLSIPIRAGGLSPVN